jgi:hypothetical protein
VGDHHAAVGVAVGVPVGEQSREDLVVVATGSEPALALVEVERAFSVAVAEELDGLAFPRLALAAVLSQLDRVEPGR